MVELKYFCVLATPISIFYQVTHSKQKKWKTLLCPTIKLVASNMPISYLLRRLYLQRSEQSCTSKGLIPNIANHLHVNCKQKTDRTNVGQSQLVAMGASKQRCFLWHDLHISASPETSEETKTCYLRQTIKEMWVITVLFTSKGAYRGQVCRSLQDKRVERRNKIGLYINSFEI